MIHPNPDTPLVDLKTGRANLEWLKWFSGLGSDADRASYTVSSIADLKAVAPTSLFTVTLADGRRSGKFIWVEGDYSDHHLIDTNNGVYVKSNTVPSTSGSWVREFNFVDYYSGW